MNIDIFIHAIESISQDTNNLNIQKTSKKYFIKDKDGSVLAEVSYFRNNTDWANASKIHIKNKYKDKNLLSLIMSELYKDVNSRHISRGLYCMVQSENTYVLDSIKKVGFKEITSFDTKKHKYYVLAKGNGNTDMLKSKGMLSMAEHGEKHGKPNEELLFQLKGK